MRRPNRDLDIIEVLDPDDPTLDWQVARAEPVAPREPEAGNGARNWIIGAVVAVAAVVAVVLVVAGNDDPAPDPEPDPTALADGRYVIDNDSLKSYSADIVTPQSDKGHYALMSSGDGSPGWVSVDAAPTRPVPAVLRDSFVREVDGLPFVSPIDDASRVSVRRDFASRWSVTVTASGLPDEEVSRIAHGVVIGTPQDPGEVSLDAADAGRSVVTTARSEEEALLGTVVTRMRYLDERADVVTLNVAEGDVDEHVRTLQFVSPTPPENVDGRVVATMPATGDHVVLWEADGHLLSLTAALDSATLVALSHDVRQATEAEWQTRLIFLHPDYRVGDFRTIVTTIDSGAPGEWEAGIQDAVRGGVDKYLWWFSLPDTPSTSVSEPVRLDAEVQPFADRFVVGDVTYVFVSVPVSSGITTATVVAGDGTVQQLVLSGPVGELDALVGAARVDIPGQARVFVPGISGASNGLIPDPLG